MHAFACRVEETHQWFSATQAAARLKFDAELPLTKSVASTAQYSLAHAYLEGGACQDGESLLGRQHPDKAQDEHLHSNALQGGEQHYLVAQGVHCSIHGGHAVQASVDIR